MRWIGFAVCGVALLGAARVEAQQAPEKKSSPIMVTTGSPSVAKPGATAEPATPPTPPPAQGPLLPDDFSGWVASEKPKTVGDPAQLDSTHAAALKEYGCTGGMVASYKRSGETLDVKALTFPDVSGAYGAYSFYRQNGWPKADIGTGGASDKNHVVFWKGNTVVDATFSHIGPMSAGELRELAKNLPVPQGNRALNPPILAALPQSSMDRQTMHFAQGPVGYAGAGGVLPPELVGFDKDAEAVTANYSLPSNPAVLTLIDYPTPQIAEAQEKRIRDYIKAGQAAQPPFTKALQDSDQASLEVRRSGPIVALVSGDAIPDESHKLIAQVHYSAELTSMPQPHESEVSKTSRFLMGVASLVIIGCTAAVLLGLFLGGGRALYRVARGRPASSVYEAEFISLHLED
ncbi:DUF6599 family protein [Occallatibacter savannae]|uniref:DUF6599 family protein n=1 Tax=Occallatibacter savannae TaxID=1002691 RepID=UPI000D694677|nr:DUF6599 family protein [Occallatibacter savannae]